MKKNRFFVLCVSAFLSTSCAIEQNNLSPFSKSFSEETAPQSLEESYNYAIKDNVNAAEITDLISSFPKFRNDGINKEVSRLKTNLQDYLYATEAFNTKRKEKAYENFEKSYIKIQNLRKYLNEDENQILNRYLVRIKTNVSVIESINKTKVQE